MTIPAVEITALADGVHLVSCVPPVDGKEPMQLPDFSQAVGFAVYQANALDRIAIDKTGQLNVIKMAALQAAMVLDGTQRKLRRRAEIERG